jgi:hypothetical protein
LDEKSRAQHLLRNHSAFVQSALRDEFERLKKQQNKGKPFPRRSGELKGGRPIKVLPEADPPAILKLLADVNLREAHSLTDGSEVRVAVPGDGRTANADRGVCIYCTVRSAVDDEHVFPHSWHPDGLPAGWRR